MKVLIINAGSSSLKYQVIDMTTETMLCKGLVERIGFSGSSLVHNGNGNPLVIKQDMSNHTEALQMVIKALTDEQYGIVKDIAEIGAVGHRVLHSGEDFSGSVVIDSTVIKICKKNAVLGPLHMPANIACIESCKKVMPKTPMVAVFDTGFHSTMPKKAFMYAIPYEDYKKYKIRKYGFHGTSHKYVTGEALKYLQKEHSKIITCHLGNGSSISAVVDGKCVDTSMGLTPLEGLIMGTRSGDIDPTVLQFMSAQKGISVDEALNILNKKSGFLGVCGVSDFRDMEAKAAAGDPRAQLCLDMFQYRIKKYIGSYVAAMGGLDLIVFTGGIGENAYQARSLIMQGLECFGIDFDFEYNKIAPRGMLCELHKPQSKVKVVIIPTNEEVVIARETMELINK
jgi:acetate kinase